MRELFETEEPDTGTEGGDGDGDDGDESGTEEAK